MKPIVLDCSVALSWCFEDETSAYSDWILDYVKDNGALVPPLWLSELTNGILTAIKKKRMDREGGLAFLEEISKLPIRVANFSAKESLADVFQLALDHSLTSYDATYLYLAIREKKTLATLDADLKNAARKAKLPKLI